MEHSVKRVAKAKQSQNLQALTLSRQMLRGSNPNAFSFPFALNPLLPSSLHLPFSGQQLHCQVIKSGCSTEPFVLTSLVSVDCKFNFLVNARKVFDKNPILNQLTVCYNALISGYGINSGGFDVIALFCRMRETGVSVNSVTMLGLVPVLAANFLELSKKIEAAGGLSGCGYICAHLGAISVGLGREVERRIESSGLSLNPF
ncbi:hypothetical protein GQ457_08G018210 [Hibiscus cannabinus]